MSDQGYEHPEEDNVNESQSGRAESEDADEVNRNLFRDNHGFPVAFFLHESIKRRFSLQNLARDIKKHGGTVVDTDLGCDTVLVDVMYRKETLQNSYNTDDNPRLRKVYVELSSFVQRCIRNNQFAHRIPAQKGMGGTVGRVRVSFTAQDDENLCYFLARTMPDKAAGGRLGLGVYKELLGMAAVRDSHEWGARHTAESWKERYKKNAVNFDERIDDIVKQEGRSRKQLWPEDRRVSHKALRDKHKQEPEGDSSDGDYKEEESPQHPRKRRRSDYSPLPPPNRRQLVQRSSDQKVGTRSSSDRKGKARAFEEDELDQLEEHVDQDEITEPGPSRSRRSPEATAVGVLTHRTQPNTASFFTQETIVATAPSGRSAQSKEVSPLPDDAAEPTPPIRQVIREAKQASPSDEPIAFIDLTSSPSGSTSRNSPIVQLSPARTLINPPQTQDVPRPSVYKRPLKAARRPRAMIKAAVVDAPYRNTRSRSQSVEPSIPNSPVRRSKQRRNKETRETRPSLPTVDEIQDDDKQDNTEVADEPMPPSAEILADEIDVEMMLMSDDFNQDEELRDADNVRGVSLDTDDAQTEQNLRPTQPPRQPFSSLRMRPSDILREFQESSATWASRYSAPLTTRPHLSNRPAVPVRNTQDKLGNIPPPFLSSNLPDTYKAAEPPRTPLRRPRKNSASSTDSFPVSGTKASALKKKLQQQEKRGPYQPPSGTRAAKFASSRR